MLQLLILFLAIFITLGGCFCCASCEWCTEEVESIQLDLTFTADNSNEPTAGNTCCAALTQTVVLDRVLGNDCCFEAAVAGDTCSTTACDDATCGGSEYFYCCNGDQPETCMTYSELETAAAIACTTDANGDTCNATETCSVSPQLQHPGDRPTCASDALCAGTFDNYDGLGYIDPGYACDYVEDCGCVKGCGSTSLTVQACYEQQGSNTHLVVSGNDGANRLWTADEDLGATSGALCYTDVQGLGLTFTDDAPGLNYLCNLPTGTATAL